jgi:hypothetical protein
LKSESPIQRNGWNAALWRFIALQHDADTIRGEAVEFTLKRADAFQLMADLEKIDLKNEQQRDEEHG